MFRRRLDDTRHEPRFAPVSTHEAGRASEHCGRITAHRKKSCHLLSSGAPLDQFRQSVHYDFPGGAVRKPLSHFEGATRPKSCSGCGRPISGTLLGIFGVSRGESPCTPTRPGGARSQSADVFHTPSSKASPIITANCYSSGRQDRSGRSETGPDVKGALCRTAQADEAVNATPQTPPRFAASSPDRIPASTSEWA